MPHPSRIARITVFIVGYYISIIVSMTEAEKLLKEYLDYLEVERNRLPKTRENYERYLNNFVVQQKIVRLAQITEDAIRDFRLALARKDLKKNTQSYYVIAIRNFLKYLTKKGYKTVPPETIELPKLPTRQIDILEYKELERLLAIPTGGDVRSLRDRAILETLFSTGLRLSELCGLKRYLDIVKGEVTVRGKGEKLRIVFLSNGAKTALKQYLDKRADTLENLFVSFAKSREKPAVIGPITPRAVQRLLDYYARKAGIVKRVHPHMIRHAFATDLLMNGADLRSVQELLGHSNVSTTQIYTHITNRQLKEIHKAFHARRRE